MTTNLAPPWHEKTRNKAVNNVKRILNNMNQVRVKHFIKIDSLAINAGMNEDRLTRLLEGNRAKPLSTVELLILIDVVNALAHLNLKPNDYIDMDFTA